MTSEGDARLDAIGFAIERPRTIRSGSDVLRLPADISSYRVREDGLLVVLDPESGESPDADIQLPERSRNVVKIGPDCRPEWFVESISHPIVDDFYHHALRYDSSDRSPFEDGAIVSQSTVGHYYFQLDVESGEIVDSWQKPNWKSLAVGRIGGVIEGEGATIRLPRGVDYGNWTPIDDDLVVHLDPSADGANIPNFEIEDPSQNLLRISSDCSVVWAAESAEEALAGAHHEESWCVGDRLITTTSDGRFTELDPETGSLVRSWDGSAFVVAGESLDLGDEVDGIEWVDGTTIVRAGDAFFWIRDDGTCLNDHEFDGPETPYDFEVREDVTIVLASGPSGESTLLTGFDASGDRLWRRRIDYRWALSTQPDGTELYTQIGKQRHTTLELDPRTGALTEESGPMRQVEEFLDG